ncbi:MAG: MASE1 domain-containing protein, partial [Actinobacteria bacterium]|nr:MASE1 domain-containing protein [Actinomycetota bacterium]
VGLAAVASTTVSATIGVSALRFAGEIGGRGLGEEWLLWWFGDLIGALLVAPPLLTCATALRERRLPGRRGEGLLLIVALIVTAIVVFVGGSWRYPYLIFPLLLWAALRFRQVGATVAVAIVGGIATWGTANGAVPIGGATATESVQILQGLIAIIGVGMFVTAATIAERDSAVAERSNALGELSERTAIYETLLEAVSDLGEGFVVTDAGRLVFANQAYSRMTGYSFEELRELPSLLELTAPEHRDEITARLRDRIAGGDVVDHYEAALIRKDGQRVECEVAVEIAHTKAGPQLVSVVRDITERKRIESFREDFVSYAAHELRGPVSVIAGFIGLLESPGVEGPDRQQVVERLTMNVRAMGERLDNILALTKIERGDARLRPELLEVEEAIASLAEGLSPPAGSDLVLDLQRGTTAYVDRGALGQMILNLTTNAYRYGGPNVRLSARSSGTYAIIEVADDGSGINADESGRIFEPFVRGVGRREAGGT